MNTINNIISWLCANWITLFIYFAIIVFIVAFVIKFFKLTKEQQKEKVSQWLLYAVSLAEKELGSGTGKLKLRYVYDWFLGKFPWLSIFISFDKFSIMVDDALEEMRKCINSNKCIDDFINENN